MTFECDDDTKYVFLSSKKNEVFSAGTDIKSMYHWKITGELSKIDEYLQSLYNFHLFIAGYHKPLIAVGSGIISIYIIII